MSTERPGIETKDGRIITAEPYEMVEWTNRDVQILIFKNPDEYGVEDALSSDFREVEAGSLQIVGE